MEDTSSHINLLPFQLQYDGPAPVKSYFLVDEKNKSEKEKEYTAHFRGRRLVGKDVLLPNNLVALHAVVGPKSSNSEGKLEIVNHQTNIRLWNHDFIPETHNMDECLDWMEIANVVSPMYISSSSFFTDLDFFFLVVAL
jgi:hypothetical protein